MKRFAYLPMIIISFTLCTPPPPPGRGYEESVPEQIREIIEKNYSEGLYAVGLSRASNEMVAINRAAMQARAEIARQFRAQIEVLQKDFEESFIESTLEEYSQVMTIFAHLEISGSQIIKSLIKKENENLYSASVLVAVSAKNIKALIDDRLSAYTSYRAARAYRELEERVARERERRGELREGEEEIY